MKTGNQISSASSGKSTKFSTHDDRPGGGKGESTEVNAQYRRKRENNKLDSRDMPSMDRP